MSKTFTLNLDLNEICEILTLLVLCDPCKISLHDTIVNQMAADPEGAVIADQWKRADQDFNR